MPTAVGINIVGLTEMLIVASSFSGLIEGLLALNVAAVVLAILSVVLQRSLQRKKKSSFLRIALSIPPIALAGLLAMIHFRDDPEGLVWFRFLSGGALALSLSALFFLRQPAEST